MKLEKDKKYRTKSGKPVRIVGFDVLNNDPVAAVIAVDTHCEYLRSYTLDGKFAPGGGCDEDLVEVHPFEGLPVDTPVMVRQSMVSRWLPRYLAKVEGNCVFSYGDGATSFSNGDRGLVRWDYYRLPTEAELRGICQ